MSGITNGAGHMSNKRTAIITGGGRGIGYGIAECLAAKGIQIAIADIDGRRAETSAEALAGEFGVKTFGVACDITARDQVDSAVDAISGHFGQIDILVNNAGICPFIHVMEMDEETFRRTIDVNLIGAFLVTQSVARVMIDQKKGGKIVFITSLAVNSTNHSQVDYAASKAGLNMLMKGFSIALAPHGINCNAVAPGMIYTDMGREYWDKPENQEYLKDRVPVGRIGYPNDIGRVVSFLVSEDSDYVDGTSLIVDGGHQACCR